MTEASRFNSSQKVSVQEQIPYKVFSEISEFALPASSSLEKMVQSNISIGEFD